MDKIMRMALCLLALLVLSTVTAAQDSDSGAVKTLYVASEPVPCQGIGPQLCLQVKEAPDEAYSLFYDSIEGFVYEPGYDYELLVTVSDIENPPADASSLRYTLVEVLSQTRALEGNIWLLDSYLNAEGQMLDRLAQSQVTAAFGDMILSGSAGCNAYSTNYTVDGSSLEIDLIVSTLMFCAPEALMDQEAAFTSLLDRVATYAIVEGQLQLSDAEGNVLLSFSPQEPLALVDSVWLLDSMTISGDAVASVLDGSEITVIFDGEGGLSGSAGCNGYSASYTAEKGLMTISPAVSTRMACGDPQGIMDQEAFYLSALENVVFYSLRGDVLDLLDGNGTMLLRFTARAIMSAGA
jgi:heat shock protein HslJ